MIGLILLVLVLAFITRQKWIPMLGLNPMPKDSAAAPQASSKPSNTPSKDVLDQNKVLQQGDRGASVKELQKILNLEHDYQTKQGTTPIEAKLTQDGIFGPKTKALLFAFTGKNSLSIHQLKKCLYEQKTGPLAAIDYDLH